LIEEGEDGAAQVLTGDAVHPHFPAFVVAGAMIAVVECLAEGVMAKASPPENKAGQCHALEQFLLQVLNYTNLCRVFLENQPAYIDTRLADDSDKALITRFRDSQFGNDTESMPLRPDFGTIGEHIKLRTNFFPVHISKGPLNEYDVAITPVAGAASRAVRRRVFQLAQQTAAWRQAGMDGTVAHDSSAKLISARLLNQPLAIKVLYYEDDQTGPPAQGGKEYTLAVTFAREINPQDLMR